MAEQDEAAEKMVVHLLDDGFQHRQLARDVDIVLLTQEDVEDTLLPAGNLREPLAALRGGGCGGAARGGGGCRCGAWLRSLSGGERRRRSG